MDHLHYHHLDWRRNKVLELSAQGYSERKRLNAGSDSLCVQAFKRDSSMNFWYFSFGAAPTVLATSLPSLNRISDGID